MQTNQGETVYISGPMTGITAFNKPAFREAEKTIKELYPEVTVLSPARHPDGLTYAEYMKLAANDLLVATVITFLPGHHLSNGSRFESEMAKMFGVRKDFSLLELPWAKDPVFLCAECINVDQSPIGYDDPCLFDMRPQKNDMGILCMPGCELFVAEKE